MSAYDPKRTSLAARHISSLGGKADNDSSEWRIVRYRPLVDHRVELDCDRCLTYARTQDLPLADTEMILAMNL
jgi:Pyruvate/2-oxoacid:ferredoxin oxidoreductase delta subunit